MEIETLYCECLKNPLGIDMKTPRLGWAFKSHPNEYAKSQTAFHILVASSQSNLDQHKGDLWDSGKIESDQSQFVDYQGVELKSRMQCFWKVKAWDEQKKELEWSPSAYWIMGIVDGDWKGQWIGERVAVSYEERFPVTTELADCPEWIKAAARREHPKGFNPENDFAYALYLRREFKIHKPIQRAILRIAGLGYNEVEINGQKIGDHVLDPGATDYTKSVLYTSYDISKDLHDQENCIGIILGNGWYWVGTPDLFGFDKADWATPPKCLSEIELKYQDGTTEWVHSDPSWLITNQGPIRFNCIRSGEVYDAQMDLGLWSKAGMISKDDMKWKSAIEVPAPKGVLRSQISPPIKARSKFTPLKHNILANGDIVYWFPKNNAGWVELKVKGGKGQKIKIQLNEILRPDGSVDMEMHSGHTYGRYQTCEYICGSDQIETWHPRFCYAGFQYVQISGAQLEQIHEIFAVQVCTAFEQSGEFYCSNHLINSINEAAKLTFLNGFHSYPEDCPQREKAGWTEDASISAHGSIYNYNALHAYKKWIQDLRDAQHESGQVPDIVPTPFWGKPAKIIEKPQFNPWNEEFVGRMADPWWGGVLILLPWRLYQHYGDMNLLKDSYSAMKKYIDFLLKTTECEPGEFTYIINWGTLLGDWLEVGSHGSANRTPRQLTCSQAFLLYAQIMAEIAKRLNEKTDIQYFQDLSEKIKDAINEEFFKQDTGLYAPDSQSAQSLALYINLAPQAHRDMVLKMLLTNIQEKWANHLSTGIVGTYFLFKTLGMEGHAETAYKIITARDIPGFEYNLTRIKQTTPLPSTTLWEDWGGVSSLAHPVQGCVSAFFYEYLAGIQPRANSPGFKEILIKPMVIEDVTWVKSELKTLYGSIKTGWTRIENKIVYEFLIPPNTIASITIPIKESQEIFLENKKAEKNENVCEILRTKNSISFRVNSGVYLIEIV
jgi:alpha-L-rhamnosidase